MVTYMLRSYLEEQVRDLELIKVYAHCSVAGYRFAYGLISAFSAICTPLTQAYARAQALNSNRP